MQTLQQLISGELKGIKKLQLSCELTTFPNEIFELAETLEILDLSNNKLSQLPENFSDLKKIKIAFFSDNNFTEFPTVLSGCESLTMIGFKSNKINHIPENSFPKHLQWLILTNNAIPYLPKSIGCCSKLQKVALAGNKLQSLPDEMANCHNIELLRISANQLSQFPEWLLSLPRLAWLACSGNPFCKINVIKDELPLIKWNDLNLQEVLGQGASGIIYKATCADSRFKSQVAIKVFKGEVTSDGFPEDEMNACITAGNHTNLVTVLGKISHHPEHKMGLVLDLIPPDFKNLGGPPSFDSCTRDTFKPETDFTLYTILKIARSIAEACNHLHKNNIMHGDLYAHNTLIDKQANTIFGDFGAATIYNKNQLYSLNFEKIDVRAFGYLIDDLLKCTKEDLNSAKGTILKILRDQCLHEVLIQRPNFGQCLEILSNA